jgi:hypothetical protein
MQAEVRVVASHLRLVQSPEQIAAAVSGDLFIDGKRVLIIKGASTAEAVEKIYKEFSVRRDLAGHPFRLSHKERGIMATDQWGEVSKVNIRDFKRFIQSWFSLAELTTHDGKPALILIKEFPTMLVPTYAQGRFVTAEMLEPFSWVD